MSQPQTWYPPPQPPRSDNRLAIALVLLVLIIAGVVVATVSSFRFISSRPRSITVVNGQIIVPAQMYDSYQLVVPSMASNVRVMGGFTSSSTSGVNDIQVYVMDNASFANWKVGHQSSSYYSSTQYGFGTITASLPGSGIYDLIYANAYGNSTKSVQTTAILYFNP